MELNDSAKQVLTFEDRLKQLDSLVAEMENGNMPLEKAVEKYEIGKRLLSELEKELENATQRVTVLKNEAEEPFDIDSTTSEEIQ